MNNAEKARYLIGKAVIDQLEQADRDPETVREINAVMNWLCHWLSRDEQDLVMIETGFVIDLEMADEIFGSETS